MAFALTRCSEPVSGLESVCVYEDFHNVFVLFFPREGFILRQMDGNSPFRPPDWNVGSVRPCVHMFPSVPVVCIHQAGSPT